MTTPSDFNGQTKAGFITLIGRTNVGKSTLMNHLIGQKIAITSNKPQTTRRRILTVQTIGDAQMVFVDTPGIHEAKNKLGEYMIKIAHGALDDVDVILWLVEPSTFIGAGERTILEHLKKVKQPVLLVVNKCDTVSGDILDAVKKRYEEEMDFAGVLFISALKDQGTDELTDSIISLLPFGAFLYDENTLADEPIRDIVAEIIREKALRLLKDEIPHGIAVTINGMKERESASGDMITDIDADLIVERNSHKGIVIGRGGSMLKKIGSMARQDIEDLIDGRANLKIFVKVRGNWRDNDTQLRSFGYR